MVSATDVVSAAREEIGTPWVHQGRLPGLALDCAGLVIVTARRLGLVPVDFDRGGYGRMPDGTLLDVCRAHMQRMSRPSLGAVAVLIVDALPQHLGIVGDYRHGGWSLIHACSDASPPRVVETRWMLARNNRVAALYRLPGVVG